MKRLRAVAACGAFGALYLRCLRRAVVTWGATDIEADSPQPGDELLEKADGTTTRAIDIDAPAGTVWPWLAQLGPAPRGGAYTYDWIENLLGLNMHSADQILEEFQHPKVGDTIALGAKQLRLERFQPGHVLTWRSGDGDWTWSFVLIALDGGRRTRLISRNRFHMPSRVARLTLAPMELGSLVMERKMLRGIKQRAESLSPAPQG
jgi:hypothetical protein